MKNSFFFRVNGTTEQSARGEVATQNFKVLRKGWEASLWESCKQGINFINIPLIPNVELLSQM